MNTTSILPGLDSLVKPFKFPACPYEYRVTALRECPTPENLQQCETPDKAADYWRLHIATHPHSGSRNHTCPDGAGCQVYRVSFE
jgi:hypothetical protein